MADQLGRANPRKPLLPIETTNSIRKQLKLGLCCLQEQREAEEEILKSNQEMLKHKNEVLADQS